MPHLANLQLLVSQLFTALQIWFAGYVSDTNKLSTKTGTSSSRYEEATRIVIAEWRKCRGVHDQLLKVEGGLGVEGVQGVDIPRSFISASGSQRLEVRLPRDLVGTLLCFQW
jgi:hypothetical protein